jgi:outer membrane protein TolC
MTRAGRSRLHSGAVGGRLRSLRVVVAMSALCMTGAGHSETLEEAWSAAMRTHSLIAAARAERDAADLDLEGAKAERYPQVGLTSSLTKLDSAPRFAFGDTFLSPRIFDGGDFVTTFAGVAVPLYAGGSIRHGIGAAGAVAEAYGRRLDAVTQDVRLAVALAYIDVLRAESALSVAGSNVDMLTAHTSDAENRYESGAVPRNDFLAASVALASARQRRLQAENALDLARAAYNRMLARDLAARVDLDAELSADVPAGSLDDLVGTAIRNRGELGAYDARADALRGQSAVERARTRPQVGFTAGYARLENEVLDDDRFWMAGIAVEWNVFDSGRSRNRAAALDRRASALAHERADREGLIGLEVRAAWLDRAEAESRRGVAQSAVEQAAENLEVVRNRYRAGASTNTEVLDAEALRTQSLDNLDGARFDAAASSLRLIRAAGAL